MSKIQDIQARMEALNVQAQAIRQKADEEQRDLTVEEETELAQTLEGFERLRGQVELLAKLDEQTQAMIQGTGRKTEPDDPIATVEDADGAPKQERQRLSTPKIEKVPAQIRNRYTANGNWNFASMGDFALSVKRACLGYVRDRRLDLSEQLASASTYGNEGTGADGGFAVPPDFRTTIMEKVMGEDSLLSRCDQVTCTGNTFTCPKDETTPWQSSGGILSYWDGEGAAATQSKPSLESVTVKLNKLRVLVPMTEEIIDDASAMDSYLRKKAPQKINFAVNLALLQGTGVGQPLGLLNSPALVTVSKETSQVADTIIGNNIIKMYARMPAPNLPNSVWVINQDILPQLLKLSVPGTDNDGNAVTGWGALVYIPPGGLSGSPFGTLFGRPVIASQACETLGDKGDIFFVDFSAYLALIKSGTNPRVETSMHLWFDQDLMAFKFVLRIGGLPWWSTSYAARDGSATYSPYITLEAR